jgi:hypothetical protein
MISESTLLTSALLYLSLCQDDFLYVGPDRPEQIDVSFVFTEFSSSSGWKYIV